MKNREKYRDKIMKSLNGTHIDDGKDSITCDFIREVVFPTLKASLMKEGYCDDSRKIDYCNMWSCYGCIMAFAFWLDEEYVEPPKPEVDWSNVPVDTLVRVRDSESEEWTLKYFKELEEEGYANRFQTWVDGATSKTAYGEYENWTHCELVEDENDDK